MKKLILPLLVGFSTSCFAQVSATPEQMVKNAIDQKISMEQSSLVRNIPFKNIGPTVMSGRVVDVAVNPENSIEFYIAYASGGVWYTNNNGTSFVPVMDQTQTQNIGDLAVDWKNGVIWVGTGENNASRSSYAGIGILKSSDAGETWENMGLPDSHHIGRMLLNPNNPEELVVGIAGHLYSKNEERGIYKTSDGGKTWKKTLFINDETGIIDMAYSPNNFDIMYAASWQRKRKAWDFLGNGRASAIYKSTDGGDSWNLISIPESGFPNGEEVGRIGLTVYDNMILYAVLDNQSRRPKNEKDENKNDGLSKEDFKLMSNEDFLNLDNKKLNDFLKENNFQEKYRAANVKQLVQSGVVKPKDISKYLEDANGMLFDTPVIGAEVYRSDDAGKTWKKQNESYIDDLYYSYGYYFGQITVDPNNSDKIYLAGVPIIKSEDGGKTFTSINGDNVHSDHHSLWVDPKKSGHLINGNDGGLNISYDDGKNWSLHNSPSVAQFYAITVDNQEPYHIYGGLQDNGVWEGPYNADESSEWHQTGKYPWKAILGGDGMQVQVDNRNHNTVYAGFQFGNYFRLDLENNKQKYIQPKHELGEAPSRFNWQTPILLSSHNQDILYLGGNKLHRSLNQGEDWETISDDLTQGSKMGNVAYGTLTTISESPFQFGLIYVGSDDGLVHRTKNGGGSWDIVSNNLPQNMWVSRVITSKHKKERVYVTLNGYRWDDFASYIYASDDFGQTWKSISAGIPASSVNVILEDPTNEDLLFVGTDNGLYTSFDRGLSWQVFQNGIPNVAVHDLVIQPEKKHLLVGTHGRGIYLADISKLQRMTPELLKKEIYLFKTENIKFSKRWGNSWNSWGKPNTPGLDLTFYTQRPGVYKAKIITIDAIEVSATEIEAEKGLNMLSYDVAFSKAGKAAYLKKHKIALIAAQNGKTYLPKGTYSILMEGNGNAEKVEFVIE